MSFRKPTTTLQSPSSYDHAGPIPIMHCWFTIVVYVTIILIIIILFIYANYTNEQSM